MRERYRAENRLLPAPARMSTITRCGHRFARDFLLSITGLALKVGGDAKGELPVRRLALAGVVGAGLIAFAGPSVGAPCDAEIVKLDSLLPLFVDHGRRQVIESLLDEAKRALMMHQPDRCMADVRKVKRALRIK